MKKKKMERESEREGKEGGIQSDKGKRGSDARRTHPPGIFTQFFPITCHLSTNCFFIMSNPITTVKESVLHPPRYRKTILYTEDVYSLVVTVAFFMTRESCKRERKIGKKK